MRLIKGAGAFTEDEIYVVRGGRGRLVTDGGGGGPQPG